ncbi:MAG: radical SAM family heme chaperone HemW, partial [Acidobacteria bacterium]|nr:radical SAM family heme chaperone HemW [Acidobacteriota bacterium]
IKVNQPLCRTRFLAGVADSLRIRRPVEFGTNHRSNRIYTHCSDSYTRVFFTLCSTRVPGRRVHSRAIIWLSKMSPAGIYIHIPFCRARCSYCDFATGTYSGPLAERYVRALAREIRAFPSLENEATEADTVYFGGGTPSLLSPAQVEAILEAVKERFNVSAVAEVTMEMNPGTLSPEVLHEFRRLGITRASFGAQTFDDKELRQLGRTHTAEDVRLTIKLLREAGFDNVSFDLIAGLPRQTVEAWARNLDEALALRPKHLSFYLLEVHEGTPLAEQIRQGRVPVPDDDVAAEMYRLMLDRASAVGYEHYEISNLSLPGFESRHNSKYWLHHPVYGFGCSAHSFDGTRRRWSNERDALRYTQLIEEGRTPLVENFELSRRDVEAEAVFLGLRLLRGINLQEHSARFGVDLRAEKADDLARLSEAGLIELTGDLLKLTRTGALFSNEVFATFV